MKKSVWLLCLFFTAFSLISCKKLFDHSEDTEKKYLSVTSMTPNDALAYIGDITDSFPSPNDHYIVRNCFGYSELYAKTVIVEYSGLSQAYSTYFSNLETNARMQFDYVNPVYNSSREYVEFIIYFEPEKKTDGYPSEAVAYELRYLCGDFTNPPATGNYAKKVILSPDMQVDILTETFIATGEKIHYWGTPTAGQLKVQSVPALTNAIGIPAPSSNNDTYDGSFGNTRKLKATEYPDVWAQMGALGTLNGIYANFDNAGNILPTSYYGSNPAESFLVEYTSLDDAVLAYKDKYRPVNTAYTPYEYLFDSDCYYVEYSKLRDFDYLSVYLLDTQKLQSDNYSAVSVGPAGLGLIGKSDSIIDYIRYGGMKQIDSSTAPDVWNRMNEIGSGLTLYAEFDSFGQLMVDRGKTTYYGAYSAFNDTASEYCDNTAYNSGFPIEIEATFIQDHSFYLEYNIYDDDSSSPDTWEATLYSADEFLNGNHDCGVGVHGYKSKSIQYTIQSALKGFSETSSYHDMLYNFGNIYFEGGDPQVYTLNSGDTIRTDFGWEGIEGYYYFAEYESLSEELISFFSTSSLTYDSMYAELDYPVDTSHYYVEYLQGNYRAGGLLLFDTQAFKDGNALYAKGIKVTSSDLEAGDWYDLWEYIISNQP